MFHRHNCFEPFGDDRAANQAALDALQPAVELARARATLDRIAPDQLNARVVQREHVARLAADFEAFADRAGVDRALFREVLQRKLRRDHGGSPDLSPLPAQAPGVDEARDALASTLFHAREKMQDTAKRLASARRIFGEAEQAALAAERALRAYDQARAA